MLLFDSITPSVKRKDMPQKFKMTAIGFQNGWRGLERSSNLCFRGLQNFWIYWGSDTIIFLLMIYALNPNIIYSSYREGMFGQYLPVQLNNFCFLMSEHFTLFTAQCCQAGCSCFYSQLSHSSSVLTLHTPIIRAPTCFKDNNIQIFNNCLQTENFMHHYEQSKLSSNKLLKTIFHFWF